VKTGAEYRDSLRDSRQVWFQGERVTDPFCHPRLRRAAEWIADIYDRFHDADPAAVNPLFEVPRSPDDLRRRIPLLEGIDYTLSTTSQLLLALLTLAGGRGRQPADAAGGCAQSRRLRQGGAVHLPLRLVRHPAGVPA
jgi:hypothetical protein